METKENVNANCMYRQMITIDSVSVSDLQEISGKDNVTIVIERGGHLVINENFAVGRNCLIDAREGCLTVNNNCTFAHKKECEHRLKCFFAHIYFLCLKSFYLSSLSNFKMLIKASDGISTVPIFLIRFLPSFCFSSNFLFLVISPP